MRSQLAQKQRVSGRIRPTVPRWPGARYSSATPSPPTGVSSGTAASTAPADRKRSRGKAAQTPIGISSMKRTDRSSARVKPTKSAISSSLTPPISTTLSFVRVNPAALAASSPSNASRSSPRRVMARKRSGRSVSRLTFSRPTPAAFKSAAIVPSSEPLVVIVSSSSPSRARSRSQSVNIPRRTRGSPPVRRILRTPQRTAADPIPASSSMERISPWLRLGTPSAAMQ